MFFEYSDKDSAYAGAYLWGKLPYVSKVYQLENNLWIVHVINSDDPSNRPSEELFERIDINTVSKQISNNTHLRTYPSLLHGRRGKEVLLPKCIGILFCDCPMANRNLVPALLRVIAPNYKFVLLALSAITTEYDFLITVEKYLFQCFLCAFKKDGTHINYGPVARSISEDEFLSKAVELCKQDF